MIRVQDEVRAVMAVIKIVSGRVSECVSVPRCWVSQAKKIVSSRFSSQIRLISAKFSFLLSEVTADPEHV